MSSPASSRATLASLAALAVRLKASAVAARLGAALWNRKLAGSPGRILFAPETLAECNAARAADIYAGQFALAGETLDVAGGSPFSAAAPSDAFARELHSFSWLVHLEASASELSSSNARALVDEWLTARSAQSAIAQEPAVVAERLTILLVVSPLLLAGADSGFRLRLMRAVGRHMRRLERLTSLLPHSMDRLRVVAALALAGTVIAEQSRVQRWALAVLGDVLRTQVLADGGHISRSPQALVEVLAALIPLREALVRRQQPLPPALSGAVDKMLPMVRFFSHGDGTMAAFHGAAPVPLRLLRALAEYDDVMGHATDNARYSGFQRLDVAGTVALMDTGGPPPPEFAQHAYASALAFEFSHGPQRIIVSCGALGSVREGWADAARATAAQSTLTVNDTSSGRILRLWPLADILGPVLYAGPHSVTAARDTLTVRASHDGYRDELGLVHERTLTLSANGLWLAGDDTLRGEDKVAGVPFAIRFHVAPGLRVRLNKARERAMIALPDGAIWLFTLADGPVLSLEESIVLGADGVARRSAQIVIAGNSLTDDRVSWHIARHGAPLTPEETSDD